MALPLEVLAWLFINIFSISLAQLEFDERLLEQRHEGMWLVEFYAPWCGHCKKLEPVYQQVFEALRGTPVHVGKLDSTRYSSVAAEFEVKGFPTIKFIAGNTVYTHRGDRTKEDIVEFAQRAQGPAVRKIASIGRFNEAKLRHHDKVFFMYVGLDDSDEDLFKKYSSVAEKYIVQSYFYAGTNKVLPEFQHMNIKSHPTVLVFKDSNYYEYEDADGVVRKSSLDSWVNKEHFTAFPKVSGGGLNEMADLGKYLVITVVDLNDEHRQESERIKQISEYLATKEREKFHRKFQFLWMPDVETANSITMSFLSIPAVVVLDAETHFFYIPEKSASELTVNTFKQFLADVEDKKVIGRGGTGFVQKLKRILYDLLTTVVGIWQASRWLFLLMFGLPTVIISIVCYSLCCMEPFDDEAVEEDEDTDIMDTDKENIPLPVTVDAEHEKCD